MSNERSKAAGHRRIWRLWRIIVCVAVGTLLVSTMGCIKVRHLGESSSGLASAKIFGQQARSTDSGRWPHKPMEAELGTVAARKMAAESKSGAKGTYSLPLVQTTAE